MTVMRRYRPEEDVASVRAIFDDVSWFRTSPPELLEAFLSGTTWVSEGADGLAGVAAGQLGWMRTAGRDIRMGLVSAVCTRLHERRRGHAGAGTRRVVRDLADNGAALAILGIFDQGYYDRLGFGSGPPDRQWTIDPASLDVPLPSRPVVRLSVDDVLEVHTARNRRWRCQGSLTFDLPEWTRAEALFPNAYGLGFRDPDGLLEAHMWLRADEERKHEVMWMAFRDRDGLLALLGLLKSLADQVEAVRLIEPAGVPLQPFLDRPHRHMRATSGGKTPLACRSFAWWQARIVDIPSVAATLLDVPPFQLVVDDPMASADWPATHGEWIVADGAAARGEDASLPCLRIGVASLTRLWMGVHTPEVLALSDGVHIPAELAGPLAAALPSVQPQLDWDV